MFVFTFKKEGFDPGSEWTLEVCITHASWTNNLIYK